MKTLEERIEDLKKLKDGDDYYDYVENLAKKRITEEVFGIINELQEENKNLKDENKTLTEISIEYVDLLASIATNRINND